MERHFGHLSEIDFLPALTLTERIKLIDLDSTASPDVRADAWLQRWLTTPAFQHNSQFDEYLNAHGITLQQFRAVTQFENLNRYPPPLMPRWLLTLLKEFDGKAGINSEILSELADEDAFLVLLAPLIVEFRRHLISVVRTLDTGSHRIRCEPVVESLTAALQDQLMILLIRPLILELNICRISGALQGETGGQRFAHFRDRLADPSFRNEILRQYPVLARHCLHACSTWLSNCREFLTRFCNDRALLETTFGKQASRPLADVIVATGDSHHGGRRVIIATLDHGFKVVYKPRSMGAAAQFQYFLKWLNDAGTILPHRIRCVLNRGRYGWAEFVEFRGCSSAEEIHWYYRRLGSLLGIIYCLAGTDCHFENLVAHGSEPVLIDIETLLQPHFRLDAHATDIKVGSIIVGSVLDTGMLPCSDSPVGDGDVSAIGARVAQFTSLQTFGFENSGTDEARVIRTTYRIEEAVNQPMLRGAAVRPSRYLVDVESGFASTYQLIQQLKRELLASNGPLSRFSQTPVRVVLRPTAAYTQLLRESFHPKALVDSIGRERILSQLWWGTASHPILRKVVFSEYNQLLVGDIPLFFNLPKSLDVRSPNGKYFKDVFSTSGFEIVHDRILTMSQANCETQIKLIRTALLGGYKESKAGE